MKDNQTEKVFRIIGASNHSTEEREATDFYSTDPDCVKDLLELERFENKILEPCCGSGLFPKFLEEADGQNGAFLHNQAFPEFHHH